jgi:hypothetical protein
LFYFKRKKENFYFLKRGFWIWTSFMGIFWSSWCSLLGFRSNSKRITIKYSTSYCWTFNCYHRMRNFFFREFLSFIYFYLGRKRFIETCNTLFSITSIITVYLVLFQR